MLGTADVLLEGRRSLQAQRGDRAWWQALSTDFVREAGKPGKQREGTRAAQSQGSPSDPDVAPCLSWYGSETSTSAPKAYPHSPRRGCNFFLSNSSFFGLQSSLASLLFPRMDRARQRWCFLNYNLLPPHATWWPVLKEMGLLQLSHFSAVACLTGRDKARVG